MIVGVPLMILIAVAGVWALLGFRVTGDRLDAVRTGGTLGVGLGGVVVLWLAVRKQRSTELDLLQKYEAHQLAERVARHNEVHQQRVAEEARDDAAERRITELYTKAVEQLGSEKAPVRLGGLYALERLAQNNESQRQTIVNVICAYLRMPYTLPAGELPDDEKARSIHEQRVQERQVRLTAQQILAVHLECSEEAMPSFWRRISIDLSGATLIDLAFRDCRIDIADFRKSLFIGGASFGGTQFDRSAWFEDAIFDSSAWFERARFYGPAWFDRVRTAGVTSFENVQFAGIAGFRNASFTDVVTCDNACFAGTVKFDGAQFGGSAFFEGTKFIEPSWVSDLLPNVSTKNVSFSNGVPEALARFCES